MCSLAISSEVKFNSSFNAQERVNGLKEKLHDISQKMSLSSIPELSLSGFEVAYSNSKKKIIGIPSWFLLKQEDIPPRFLVDDVNDPRLTNDQFLNEFSNWINDTLKDSGLASVCRQASPRDLQNIILLLRDREQFEKSKDFTLAHESAHLLYEEQRTLPLGLIILGIIAAVVSLIVIPFLGLTVGLLGLGAGIVIGLVGYHRLSELSDMEKKKQADLDAVKMLGTAEGGIYDFETELMMNRRVRFQREQLGQSSWDIDARGNF